VRHLELPASGYAAHLLTTSRRILFVLIGQAEDPEVSRSFSSAFPDSPNRSK
jgi:hypothetical protein